MQLSLNMASGMSSSADSARNKRQVLLYMRGLLEIDQTQLHHLLLTCLKTVGKHETKEELLQY